MPAQSIAIAAGTSGYSSPFAYGAHENIATVNAGNPGLWVGGDGINKTFSKELLYSDRYKEDLHKPLLEVPVSADGFISVAGIKGAVPEAFVQKGNIQTQVRKAKTDDAPDGTIIIDVLAPNAFDPSRRETLSPNKAMVYVVPPNRANYASDQDFLGAVTQTAVNMVNTMQAYNERHPGNEINTLRTCAFSSDLFAGTVPALDVAQAIIDGIESGIQGIEDASKALTIRTIEYEDGKDQVFTKAAARSKEHHGIFPAPPEVSTPLSPTVEAPEISVDSTRKNVVQVAANLLRLGGGTGDHILTSLSDRLRELGSPPIPPGTTPKDAEKLLEKIPELKGCFVTGDKKGRLLVLEAKFRECDGSQEEAAYNKFIELGCMKGAANQQAWNQILGDSCRRVCSEIEKGGVTDPEMMRDAIGLFQSQSRQADDKLAKQFNTQIKKADIGILTRLEEKHASFSVPGTEGLMVHQLYAPQCSDKMLQFHHTMQAVHHPEMAKESHGKFPAEATIKKAQEGSFAEAAQEGAIVHTVLIGSQVYASKARGFVRAVTNASKEVFNSRPDVIQEHSTDVAGTIEDSVSLSSADPAKYEAEGPEIKKEKISDLVTSFFQYFQDGANTNKNKAKSSSEDTTLYDANSIRSTSGKYAASKLPIKEVIHSPGGKLEIIVSEAFFKIYDSLPGKDKDILKETLKAGINGKSISDTQKEFLDKLGTMNDMDTKALAKSITGDLDIRMTDDAKPHSKTPAAMPSARGSHGLGGR